MNMYPIVSFAPDADTARGLAALAHPVRIKILRQLGERDACCVKDMVRRVGMAQSTVSQHLKVLVGAGLVRYRSDGPASRYSLQAERLHALAATLGAIAHACCSDVCAGPQHDKQDRDDDRASAQTARCKDN